MQSLIKALISASNEVSRRILPLYYSKQDLQITQKQNKTPLTRADIIAHEVLVSSLQKFEPTLPILSEESPPEDFQRRQTFQDYWLIDPLDGTREFINATDEFCISIALISAHYPILGFLFAPVTEVIYFGYNKASYKRIGQQEKLLQVSQCYKPLRIALSRRHHQYEAKGVLDKIGDYESIHLGSALKFGLIAEGKADVYLRFGATGEWDTAAGQCILENAGGKVVNLVGERLSYNQRDSVINPAFIAIGDKSINWQSFV